MPSYHCRGLLFSSQESTAEHRGDDQSEWAVDVYPKGVWYQRCLTVYKPPGLEVPERVLKTVRVSVSTKRDNEQRVRVGVLITGWQDGFEHIRKVHTRNYFFGQEEQVVNFDDIVEYDDLNGVPNMRTNKSHFLSDEGAFRVTVVITPLSEYSSLESS